MTQTVFEQPPKFMRDRIVKFSDKFSEMVRSLSSVDFHVSHKSHPYVPTGYYDNLDSVGQPLVFDIETGNLVLKRDTVLLSTGRFLNKTSRLVIKTNDVTDFVAMCKHSFEPSSEDGRYYFEKSLNTYIQFYIDDFVPYVSQGDVARQLSEAFLNRTAADYDTLAIDLVASFKKTYVNKKVKNISSLVALSQAPFFSSFFTDASIVNYNIDLIQGSLVSVHTPPNRNQIILANDTGFCQFIVPVLQTSRSARTDNNSGRLINYSAKVTDYKKGFKILEEEKAFAKNPIYLGLELEVVSRLDSDFNYVIQDMANSDFGQHMIVKSDTSTGYLGMEIVTIPATLNYHKKMFEDNFFNKDNAFNKRLTTTSRCGIHVHISKKSFTTMDLGKFMTFINSLANKTFMREMAGRELNAYCERISLPRANRHGIDLSAKVVKEACQNGRIKNGLARESLFYANRRQTVNSKNAQTIEVRLFASSVNKNNIFRKLEFCESLVKFVKQYSMQDMTVTKYIDFLLDKDRQKEYPYMIRWLASKNFITHERKVRKDAEKIVNKFTQNKKRK